MNMNVFTWPWSTFRVAIRVKMNDDFWNCPRLAADRPKLCVAVHASHQAFRTIVRDLWDNEASVLTPVELIPLQRNMFTLFKTQLEFKGFRSFGRRPKRMARSHFHLDLKQKVWTKHMRNSSMSTVNELCCAVGAYHNTSKNLFNLATNPCLSQFTITCYRQSQPKPNWAKSLRNKNNSDSS